MYIYSPVQKNRVRTSHLRLTDFGKSKYTTSVVSASKERRERASFISSSLSWLVSALCMRYLITNLTFSLCFSGLSTKSDIELNKFPRNLQSPRIYLFICLLYFLQPGASLISRFFAHTTEIGGKHRSFKMFCKFNLDAAFEAMNNQEFGSRAITWFCRDQFFSPFLSPLLLTLMAISQQAFCFQVFFAASKSNQIGIKLRRHIYLLGFKWLSIHLIK